MSGHCCAVPGRLLRLAQLSRTKAGTSDLFYSIVFLCWPNPHQLILLLFKHQFNLPRAVILVQIKMKAFGFLSLLLLQLSISGVDSVTKIKRVKAGKDYKDHEEVHIVVNKVG